MKVQVLWAGAVLALFLFAATPFAQAEGTDTDTGTRKDRQRGCVRTEIIKSPPVVPSGERFRVLAGVKNCGKRPARIGMKLFLVKDGRRIAIGGARTALRGGHASREVIGAHIPDRVPPGRYTLVLVARSSTRAAASDRVPIVVE